MANENPPGQLPHIEESQVAVGAALVVQASLVGVHNTVGEAIVLNGIAQYVLNAAGDSPEGRRDVWNRFVTELRDIYFAIAEL